MNFVRKRNFGKRKKVIEMNEDLDEIKRLANERKLINRDAILKVIEENMVEHKLIKQSHDKVAKFLWKEAHEYILAAIEREERKRERRLAKDKSAFDFMLLDLDKGDEDER